MKETASWSVRFVVVLVGLPVLVFLVVIIAGFCRINFDIGVVILLRYVQIPALLLGPGHVENKMLTPKTATDWLIVTALYFLLSFCLGLAAGLIKERRKT